MSGRIPAALLVATCLCVPSIAVAGPPAGRSSPSDGSPAPASADASGAGRAPEQGAPATGSEGGTSTAAANPEAGAPRPSETSPAPSTTTPPSDAPSSQTEPGTPAPDSAGTETQDVVPQAGGIAGVVSANDPNATKATRELEGEALDDALPAGVPERMTKLQRAAWWTMFGAIGLGATGGVFAGLVEREEDRAVRLQRTYDLDAGARPLYADVRAEYEDIVARGETFEATSIGLLSVGAAAFVSSVVLFSVNGARNAAREDRARERGTSVSRRRALGVKRGVELRAPRAGLVEVRF